MLPIILWILLLFCLIVAIQRIPAAAFFIYERPVKQAKDGVAPRRQRAAYGGVAAAPCLCFIPRSLTPPCVWTEMQLSKLDLLRMTSRSRNDLKHANGGFKRSGASTH